MAAAARKRRQSSLFSFFPSPLPHPSNGVSDYERIREENIRRNHDFFEKLGIKVPTPPQKSLTANRTPKTKLHTKIVPTTTVPLRRSTRKRSVPSTPESETEDKIEEIREVDYRDSSVLQYTCDSSSAAIGPLLIHEAVTSSPVSGFKMVGETLHDRALARIYSVDICNLKSADSEKVLVAAGGHGGVISVYGTRVEGDEIGEDEDGSQREVCSSLMCWKSSSSWVSGVSFLSEKPLLLVSSSNDGGLVVWDIARQSSSTSSPPPVVAELRSIHSKGVFAMGQMEDVIATASKDSSVGICRIGANNELKKECNIIGHHDGVIRGICFRDTRNVLADCGADGRICVLDTRASQPCTLSIDSQHSSGVNTVEWSPLNEFLLLSASKGPTLLLYDVRNSKEPFLTLQGHVQSKTGVCYQIYRPSFIDRGRAVATPGPGSKKISLYSVESGMLLSQGLIGYDANLVQWSSGVSGKQRLWVAGKQINQLSPVNSLAI